jgi:hypothetical protein
LTQGDIPWNPSSFSDQVADKFYQQVIVIDNERKNSLNTKPDDSSDIKVDLVEQGIPKLIHLFLMFKCQRNICKSSLPFKYYCQVFKVTCLRTFG